MEIQTNSSSKLEEVARLKGVTEESVNIYTSFHIFAM